MKFIPAGVTQKIGMEILTMKKHSPRIMFVAGIAGTIASTVLACRATMKLPAMLDEMQSDIDATKELKHSNQGVMTQVDRDRDVAYAYGINAYRVVKLYAPAILIGSASIALLTGSHITLSRRNAGLTAAYAALQNGFDAYRERVREELGDEKEKEIHQAATMKHFSEDPKVAELRRNDPNKYSIYAKIFDEFNPNWVKNAEYNRNFLQVQQTYANHRLQARGHLFLNEVYESLGFEHTQAGAVVGWVVGCDGDNFVDFGMFSPGNSEFINGFERSIVLDFNVDGVMYNLI